MDIYNNPKHPYTVGLLNSVPTLEVNSDVELPTIPGEVHDLSSIKGCVYRSRCAKPTNDCKEGNIEMELIEIKPGHWVDQCCINCK